MHDQGIVHGNLKGVRFRALWSPSRGSSGLKTNILINRTGQACLADFSLLTVVSDRSSVMSSSVVGGTIQWMSPELLDPKRFGLKGDRLTKQSDCYALGMVVYEVLSGQTPFASLAISSAILMILDGKRPKRPQVEDGALSGVRTLRPTHSTFTENLWMLTQRCWNHDPHLRPEVSEVLQVLLTPPSDVDKVAEICSDDDSNDTASDPCTFPRLI